MADSLVFATNHPVTLRWVDQTGLEVERRGRLHRISHSGIAIMLGRQLGPEDSLPRGGHVTVEAGESQGRHLTIFHGSVMSVESRLIRISVNGGIEVLQRRRFPRARLVFRFSTAVLLGGEVPRFFVAQPIDLSGGGVRISHRLPLEVGARFRLVVRLTRNTMVAPIAEVIETWEEHVPQTRWSQPKRFVSRASFVEIVPRDRQLIAGYVAKVLEGLERHFGGGDQPATAAGTRH